MKERQRWRLEEDALLHAYVKQYGPRDWHLLSQRMNKPINRDAKSCLERWKNYLKPGIKKGSLTEDEQRLVVNLQAKHGNKWKKIAAQVPGRTAKRLGKWWELFKEKQLCKQKEGSKIIEPIEQGKYDHLLETFAEKLVKGRSIPGIAAMPSSNCGFLHTDQPAVPSAQSVLPPWLASSSTTPTVRPQPHSPSVTLSLSPSTAVPQVPTLSSWLHADHSINNAGNFSSIGIAPPMLGDTSMVGELIDCCKEIEEGQRAWAAHRKEAAWRLKRVELQLEAEKASRRREKMDDIEAKIKALKEEQRAALDRIELEYREQLAGLRREAELKEQKLAEQWAAKHLRLTKFLEQLGYRSTATAEPNGR